MDFLLSVSIVASVYVAMFVAERAPRLRFRPLPYRRPFLTTDVAWYGVAVAMTAISMFALRPLIAPLAIVPAERFVLGLPVAIRLALGFLLFDLISYGVHRGLHRSNLLWKFHKVHHSTLQLDGLAATRTHMFENMVRFVPGQLAMVLIGIPAAQIPPVVAMAAIYGIFDHSNLGLDFSWAERVFVTPRLHRRHHVPATTNRNFGATLNVWDRIFGTFIQIDTAAHERFGVPGEMDIYPQRFEQAVRQPVVDLRSTSAPLADQLSKKG